MGTGVTAPHAFAKAEFDEDSVAEEPAASSPGKA